MNQPDRDALNRAKELAHHTLLAAESAIDTAFGHLYARKNPQLVRTMCDLIFAEYSKPRLDLRATQHTHSYGTLEGIRP